MTVPYDIGPDCHPSGTPFRNLIPRYRVLSRECATRQCQDCDGTATLHGPLGPYKPGDPCMHHCHTTEATGAP